MKMLLIRLFLCSSGFLAGCGTLVGYMSECFGPECRKPHEKVEYYQAVKIDIVIWNLPEEEDQIKLIRWVSKPILLIDFPISAAVDTALLPFQMMMNIGRIERDSRSIDAAENEADSTGSDSVNEIQ